MIDLVGRTGWNDDDDSFEVWDGEEVVEGGKGRDVREACDGLFQSRGVHVTHPKQLCVGVLAAEADVVLSPVSDADDANVYGAISRHYG